MKYSEKRNKRKLVRFQSKLEPCTRFLLEKGESVIHHQATCHTEDLFFAIFFIIENSL